MGRIKVILLSILSISCYVTEEDLQIIDRSLTMKIKDKSLLNYKLESIKIVLNQPEYGKIRFYSLSGSGTYGYVFSGINDKDQKLAIKVHFEDSKSCDSCWNAYKSQQAIIATEKVKYIIKMERPVVYEMAGSTKTYVCAFLMEKGYVASSPMFADPKKMDSNTNKIVNFIEKTVEGFAYLNFGAGFYHADVKPANLLWVNVKDGLIEPRIIDFDLSFKTEINSGKTGFKNFGDAAYTRDYRSPELLSFIPKWDFENDSQRAIYERDFVFDVLYREESFAVGKSLREILKINESLINVNDDRIINIDETLKNMMISKIGDRWSTKSAWEYLQKPLEKKAAYVRKYI